MVTYYYDRNAILTEAMKNSEEKTIINACEKLQNNITTNGLKLRFQKLDNEASNILILIIQHKKIDLQLVPQNMHWHNAA